MSLVSQNYISHLATALQEYCKQWGYDWVEKLKTNSTPDKFFRTFCNITPTHFFKIGEDHYGAAFERKTGTVKIYRCGKDCKTILTEEPVEKLIKEILKQNH